MPMKYLLILVVLTYLSTCQAWNSESDTKGIALHSDHEQQTDNELGNLAKRQLVPLPRIGRSMNYSKRQSIIPAPRIGRSDNSEKQNQLSAKLANTVDCAATPELCENVVSSSGTSSNEDLVEPIDIQLRAAFIPRLGKRRLYMEDSASIQGEPFVTESNKSLRRLLLLPGLGYRYVLANLDPDSINNVDVQNQDNDDIEGSQRVSIIRALLGKRAIPYTPRIGRAVFAPRIGKKATFVPRIG